MWDEIRKERGGLFWSFGYYRLLVSSLLGFLPLNFLGRIQGLSKETHQNKSAEKQEVSCRCSLLLLPDLSLPFPRHPRYFCSLAQAFLLSFHLSQPTKKPNPPPPNFSSPGFSTRNFFWPIFIPRFLRLLLLPNPLTPSSSLPNHGRSIPLIRLLLVRFFAIRLENL